MKKMVTLFLVLSMIFGLSAASLAEWVVPEEFVKIDLGIWDIMEAGDGKLTQYLREKFNFDITIRNQDWENNSYTETFKLWAAADDLPDAFCGYADQPWFIDFIDEELLRDIPVEMMEKYPRAYEQWKTDSLSQALYNYYGKVYYFPRLDGKPGFLEGAYTSGAAMYYRKDWAKKLGRSEPTNLDELLDLLIAFAQEDPDGNGQADTYGLTTTFRRSEGLFSWFNAYPFHWIVQDGQFIPGYMNSETMVDALTWMRTAYQAGGLDPEYAGQITGFSSSTFGAYVYHSNPGWMDWIVNKTFGEANPDLGDPLDVVGYLVALPRHAGEDATVRPYFSDTMTVFSYKASDAVVDRMLNLIEWIMGDEGLITVAYGFEGETYEVTEAGKYKSLTDTFLADHPLTVLSGLPSWRADSDFDIRFTNRTGDEEAMMRIGTEMLNSINAASHNPRINFALVPSILSTPEKAGFTFDYQAGLVKIITGTDDVAQMYDAFVAEAYDYGMQEVIDSINTVFNK